MVNGLSGTGTATLNYIALTAPSQIAIGQFPSATLNTATGDASTAVLPVTDGVLTGMQYFQPFTGATGLTTYTAQAGGGAVVIVLHYVQQGNALVLAESGLENSSGTASVSDTAQTNALHAVVALPVNFTGSGTVQLLSSGPVPIGVGVAMVPNALPDETEPNGFQYQSNLYVGGVSLKTSTQVDLYTTQLPFDITSTISSITFTPTDPNGPLQVQLSVLSATNGVITSGTSVAGQPLTIPLSGLTPEETLRFQITPVPGTNLGSGGYTLAMTVNTANPLPYLVTEKAFYPYSADGKHSELFLPASKLH